MGEVHFPPGSIFFLKTPVDPLKSVKCKWPSPFSSLIITLLRERAVALPPPVSIFCIIGRKWALPLTLDTFKRINRGFKEEN